MKNLIKSLALVAALTVVGTTRTQALTFIPICPGGTTVFSVSPGARQAGWYYDWYTPAGTRYYCAKAVYDLAVTSPDVGTWTVKARYGCGGTLIGQETVYFDYTTSVGGTATADVSTVCSGGSTTIRLTGNTGAIQWYSSSDCVNWNIISGATSATYTTPGLTATTCYGATSTCATPYAISSFATVTVNVPSAPTAGTGGAVCVGSTLSLTATTVAGATYAWTGPNGFTSAVQNPTRPNATTAMTGTYSVTATVAGCPSAAGTTVATVVDDTQPPSITCPTDVTVSANSGCTAINVILDNPVTGDNCSVASVVNNAPASYPLGTNVVTWTVTDGSGNTATCTQKVIVRDTTPPTITTPPRVTLTL